jgi:hypothetical protein
MHTALSFAGDNRTAVSFGLLAAMQSIVLLVVRPALLQSQYLSLFVTDSELDKARKQTTLQSSGRGSVDISYSRRHYARVDEYTPAGHALINLAALLCNLYNFKKSHASRQY